MGQKIYEIIDTSDCEAYYPLAIFYDFETAMDAIKAFEEEKISDRAEEFEEIKIMEREFGWGDNGKEVFVMNREAYDTEDGEERWRRIVA